jgi:plasmid stabilization system protein ParE
MKFRYKLARSAKRDLQGISDYWTDKAGPNTALKILTGILETIITISGQPRIGVKADQFGVGVRKFPAGRYVIYYRENDLRGIEILHVFHSAQNQRMAWRDAQPKMG